MLAPWNYKKHQNKTPRRQNNHTNQPLSSPGPSRFYYTRNLLLLPLFLLNTRSVVTPNSTVPLQEASNSPSPDRPDLSDRHMIYPNLSSLFFSWSP